MSENEEFLYVSGYVVSFAAVIIRIRGSSVSLRGREFWGLKVTQRS